VLEPSRRSQRFTKSLPQIGHWRRCCGNPSAYELDEVMAGAAQLDIDMAASAAADIALDPALAAKALLTRFGAGSRRKRELA
jgi:hypothetical protein